MSSATSTEAGLQPWHFFVIVTMLAATAAVVVARETSFENLLLVSLTIMAVGVVAAAMHRTLWPLASAELRHTQVARGGRTRLAIEREKTLVLRSIKELEFDRAMGKVADADFGEMSARLRARAIGLMKQLDVEQRDWATHIDREVARRIEARRTDDRVRVGEGHGIAPQGAGCVSCGTLNDPDARFCKRCGTRFADADVALGLS